MERKTYQDILPYCTLASTDPANAVQLRFSLDGDGYCYLFTRMDYSNCGCYEVHMPAWRDDHHRDLLALFVITGGFGYGLPYVQYHDCTAPDGNRYYVAIPGAPAQQGGVRNMLRLTYPCGGNHKTGQFVRRIGEIIGDDSVSLSNQILNCNSGNNIQCAVIDVDYDRLREQGKWEAVEKLAAKYNLVHSEGVFVINKEDK